MCYKNPFVETFLGEVMPLMFLLSACVPHRVDTSKLFVDYGELAGPPVDPLTLPPPPTLIDKLGEDVAHRLWVLACQDLIFTEDEDSFVMTFRENGTVLIEYQDLSFNSSKRLEGELIGAVVNEHWEVLEIYIGEPVSLNRGSLYIDWSRRSSCVDREEIDRHGQTCQRLAHDMLLTFMGEAFSDYSEYLLDLDTEP